MSPITSINPPAYLTFTKETALAVLYIAQSCGWKFDSNVLPHSILEGGNERVVLRFHTNKFLSLYSREGTDRYPFIPSVTEFLCLYTGAPLTIGTFCVDRIRPTGFAIGCQRFTWSQLDEVFALPVRNPIINFAGRKWTADFFGLTADEPVEGISHVPWSFLEKLRALRPKVEETNTVGLMVSQSVPTSPLLTSPVAPGINPHGLTLADVGEGYRLLDVREDCVPDSQYWDNASREWSPVGIWDCYTNGNAGTVRVRVHNPYNLTPEQVGVADGWRLLDANEIDPNALDTEAIEWGTQGYNWRPTGSGRNSTYSYRTRLTRAELRAARKLRA